MKLNKTKFLLIFLLFVFNLGFFTQINGNFPRISESETMSPLASSYDLMDTSTELNTNYISYERNDWEPENILQRDSKPLRSVSDIPYPTFLVSATQYVPHVIIQIDGNADFMAYNFTGRGTLSDPYMIVNLSITASHTHLIYIRNTDVYFQIRDNYLNGINRSYNAVFLQNVTNGLVIDNHILNVETGVYLEGAHFNDIYRNEVLNTSLDGINIWASGGVNIFYNDIWGVVGNGIYISSACNATTISGNTLTGNEGWGGINLEGSYSSVVTNNIIGYQYNGNGITLGYWGMPSTNTYATINNNTIYECRYRGIRVEFTNENSITKNVIYGNREDGIHFYSSMNNFVENNEIFDNDWDGILISALSVGNQFYSNNIFNNSVGIFIDNSSSNELFGNGIFYSRAEGIVIHNSPSTEISFNDIIENWESGIHAWGSIRNLYIGNNSVDNNSRITHTYPDEFRAGIFVRDFDGIIAGNYITNNQDGIYAVVSAGGQIYGNDISVNERTGIVFISTNNTNVGDNWITNNGGDGILFGLSNGNIVMFNHILENQGNGIVLFDSNYNTIEKNEIANNSGISNNPLSSEIKFSIEAVTNGHGVFLDPCIGNVIVENQIYGNAGSGTYLLDSSQNEIYDNSIRDNLENGIFLEGSSNNLVLRNYIASNGDPDLLYSITRGEISFKIGAVTNGHGVFLDPTSENVIRENVIENNVANGVHLYLSDHTEVSNNEISGNANGIALEDSNENNITLNTIFENGAESEKRQAEYPFLKFSLQAVTNGHGVFLDPSDYNIIEGNNIFSNTGNGIFLVDSDNTKIYHNVLSVNMLYGVNIDSASGDTVVSSNDFFENKYPENLEPGSQAKDDGQHNDFDHNYWSDWIGEGSYPIDGVAGNVDANPADNPINPPGYFMSIPTVIYPSGGEVLEKTVAVQWEKVYSEKGDPVKYWLFYSSDAGVSWINIPMATYEIITTADNTTRVQYMWDTTTVGNGVNYLIKVTAVDLNGFSTFDTSNDVFTIKNEVIETTTTTKTTDESQTTPQISPSWSYIVAFLGLAILLSRKKRKSF